MTATEPPLSESAAEPNGLDDRIVRRVMANQMLFQAGNSLTTGSFFNYFVFGFHPSAFWLAVLMIVPETCQAVSVLCRPLTLWIGQRKRVWATCLLLARTAALLIPFSLLFPAAGKPLAPILFLVACSVVWYLAQGVSFVNYLSWISDLALPSRWGHLLSRRQVASLMVGVCVPLGALALRRQVLNQLPDAAERWSYAVVFWLGGGIVLLSLLPLWKVSDIPLAVSGQSRRTDWRELLSNRLFQCLLASRWTAAFFQGLTQSVLFKFSVDILKISLETSMCLVSLMLLVQLPLCWWAGKICDAQRDRTGMFVGLLLVSLAMPCWLLATPQNWGWLIVAYLLWGGFGLVNVCGVSLCFKLSPRSDNLSHVALYEQASGLIAGMAGLIGGWWLDQLLSGNNGEASSRVIAFQVIMLVSWIGRTMAPLWLLCLPRAIPFQSKSH